jgi:cytoskeletal protein CcmA (bactofilin family)
MKELKEIRFNDSNLILKDNLVKSAILPEKISELNRNIVIQENTVIEGAVYATKLEIQSGDIEIQGTVFANLELFVNSNATGQIMFKKSVASSNSIVSRATKCNLIFGSDINSKKVTLYNAFVAGSIYADEIELKNCVVIGGVFATQNIDIENSIIGTFNGPTVKISQNIYILLPSAFTIEPIIIAKGVKFYNLTLADLGALYKKKEESIDSGKIKIDTINDEIKTTLTDVGMQKTLRSYTVIGKVLAADLLDIDKFQNHFLLASASLGSQLLKTYEFGTDNEGKPIMLTLENLKNFFFDILNEKIVVKGITGSFDISEITKSFK